MKSMRRFFSRWQNWLAASLVLVFIIVAAAAPLLAPPPTEGDPAIKIVGKPRDHVPQPPSSTSPLGTLPGQIDVYH
jgi:hypothetical protein